MLVDANIFLEILLNQERAQAARNFVDAQAKGTLFISDFSLNSIGLKLFLYDQKRLLEPFYLHLKHNRIQKLSLESDDVASFINNSERWKLDFDDAYQYALAKKYGLSIVSFDKDFDKTDIVRIEPK